MEELIIKPDYPFVTAVEAFEGHKLRLTFQYREQRTLDMRPYMIGVFTELKNPDYFRHVQVDDGSICWPNGQDLAYDMLYQESTPIKK